MIHSYFRSYEDELQPKVVERETLQNINDLGNLEIWTPDSKGKN
jgi:hypothetical protein